MSDEDRVGPIEYAGAFTPAARRWSRLALGSAAVVVVTAGVGGALLWLVNENRLPAHFLCCRYPGVTAAVFVLMPSAGALGASAAVVRVARQPHVLRGLAFAIPALLLNLLLAFLGVLVYSALKA
jgi:hypothetical protein